MNDEDEAEEEATQEVANQTRATSPEKSDQNNENTEEVFQAETSQGKDTVPEEQSPGGGR